QQQCETDEAAVQVRLNISVVRFVEVEIKSLGNAFDTVAHPKTIVTSADQRIDFFRKHAFPDVDATGQSQIAAHGPGDGITGVEHGLADQEQQDERDDVGLEIFDALLDGRNFHSDQNSRGQNAA